MTKTQYGRSPMYLEPIMEKKARRFARASRSAGIPVFLCLASIASGWGGPGMEEADTIVYSRMKDSLKKDTPAVSGGKEDRLSEVTASVKTDRVQPDVERGIEFVIEIVNDSSQRIELSDPFDGTDIALFNRKSGHRVGLPSIDPDFLVCGHQGTDPTFRERHRTEKDSRRAFRLVEPGLHARGYTAGFKGAKDIRDEKMSLDPGEHFEMRLSITKILADPESYRAKRIQVLERDDDLVTVAMKRNPPVDTSDIIPIAPGDYTLRVWLWVRTGVAGEDARSLASDEIAIHLGPPAGEEKGP